MGLRLMCYLRNAILSNVIDFNQSSLLFYYAIDPLLTVINLLGNPFIGFQIFMILNCRWLVAR